ncbi:unnamed protein product, partial [Effrenium voratum]
VSRLCEAQLSGAAEAAGRHQARGRGGSSGAGLPEADLLRVQVGKWQRTATLHEYQCRQSGCDPLRSSLAIFGMSAEARCHQDPSLEGDHEEYRGDVQASKPAVRPSPQLQEWAVRLLNLQQDLRAVRLHRGMLQTGFGKKQLPACAGVVFPARAVPQSGGGREDGAVPKGLCRGRVQRSHRDTHLHLPLGRC